LDFSTVRNNSRMIPYVVEVEIVYALKALALSPFATGLPVGAEGRDG
jgi:hypothetical protein